jgi:hypothetical protein
MNITKLSKQRLTVSATRWTVAREYFDPLFNYLVYGFEPGSFWTAVLANDFARAVQHSHPSNDIPALKNVVGWMTNCFPDEAYGDYDKIGSWLQLDAIQRRMLLEEASLVYTEQEEIMLALKGVQAKPEAVLW